MTTPKDSKPGQKPWRSQELNDIVADNIYYDQLERGDVTLMLDAEAIELLEQYELFRLSPNLCDTAIDIVVEKIYQLYVSQIKGKGLK